MNQRIFSIRIWTYYEGKNLNLFFSIAVSVLIALVALHFYLRQQQLRRQHREEGERREREAVLGNFGRGVAFTISAQVRRKNQRGENSFN